MIYTSSTRGNKMSLVKKVRNVITFPFFVAGMLLRSAGYRSREERRKDEEDLLDYLHTNPGQKPRF
jgi:hypothetical protein